MDRGLKLAFALVRRVCDGAIQGAWLWGGPQIRSRHICGRAARALSRPARLAILQRRIILTVGDRVTTRREDARGRLSLPATCTMNMNMWMPSHGSSTAERAVLIGH